MTGIQVIFIIIAILALVIVSFWCGANWTATSYRMAEKRAKEAVRDFRSIVHHAAVMSSTEIHTITDSEIVE